ncbi:MAG: hypothetical protein GY828_07330 [Candidatus Gracilibacteria bacterium]|nr:hypothetical protein [Candidatus Gracilibacteria bacterium]
MNIFCIILTFGSYEISSAFQPESLLQEKNTVAQYNILEDYLTEHKEKILTFQKKYNISSNIALNNLIGDIDSLVKIVKQLKKKEIYTYNNKEISQHIINRIKEINIELKPILIEEKKRYEVNLVNKKELYKNTAIKVGKLVHKIIENIATRVKKSNLSIENKIKIVIHLKNLHKQSKLLHTFGSKHYKTEKEMKYAFVDILKDIRRDMKAIKNIFKSH